uniref:Prohibitin n=1 Tax=Eutreptiella gymnastica TaxID=73025 RepID=A0A7S4CX08_9EUGL
MNQQLGKLGAGLIGLSATWMVAGNCLFVVDAGECAVKYDRIFGVLPGTYPEGLHFMVPFIQRPHIYDVKIRPREIQTRSGTKDQQQVRMKLRVLHHPVTSKLPWLYDRYGTDYDERILPSIGNEILKAVVAQYNAEELITKREAVSLKIRSLMEGRAKEEFGMILEDVSLMDLQFGAEFMQAVEAKQVAQQEAERHKFVVLKNQQEKEASIIRAEGEAEAAAMISNALARAGPGLIELRRIEAAKDIARSMSGAPNVSFIPAGSNILVNASDGGVNPFRKMPDTLPPPAQKR